jgi:prevent-host-death family protein
LLRVSASEFQRDIGRYQDIASREPVALTRDGAESCVLISAEEYRRLKRRDREAIAIEDFTEFEAEAVRRAEAPAETAEFDSEFES